MAVDPFNVEPRFCILGFIVAGLLVLLQLAYVTYLVVGALSAPSPVDILQRSTWGNLPNLWFCAIQVRPQFFGQFADLFESIGNSSVRIQNGIAKEVLVNRETFTLTDLAEKGAGYDYVQDFKSAFQLDAARSNVSLLSVDGDAGATYDFSMIPCAFVETSSLRLGFADESEREIRINFRASVPTLPLGGRLVAFAESATEGYKPWISQVARSASVVGRAWMPQDVSVTKRVIEFQELWFSSEKREIFTSSISSSLPNEVFIESDGNARRLSSNEIFGQQWNDKRREINLIVNFHYEPVVLQFHRNMWWNLLDLLTQSGQYFAVLGVLWMACFTPKLRESQKLTVRGQELEDALIANIDDEEDDGEEDLNPVDKDEH